MGDETTRWVAHAADGTRVAIDVRRVAHDNARDPCWIASWVDAEGDSDQQHGASAQWALSYALAEISYEHSTPLVEVLRDGEPSRAELLAALRALVLAARSERGELLTLALVEARRLLAAAEVR